MGLVQRCRDEGRREGNRQDLLAGIELGLELKFGAQGLDLVPEIRVIEDIALLRALQAALRTADSPEAVRRVYMDR